MGAWQPDPGADSEEVSRLGWKLFRMGLVMLAFGLLATFGAHSGIEALGERVPWLADQTNTIAMFAVAPGFFAIVIGGYRGLLGTDPEADGGSQAQRLAVGVSVGCGALLFVTIGLLAIYWLAKAIVG